MLGFWLWVGFALALENHPLDKHYQPKTKNQKPKTRNLYNSPFWACKANARAWTCLIMTENHCMRWIYRSKVWMVQKNVLILHSWYVVSIFFVECLVLGTAKKLASNWQSVVHSQVIPTIPRVGFLFLFVSKVSKLIDKFHL